MTGKKETKKIENKEGKISLILFKELRNISNPEYAGFKTSLKAEDGTEFPESKLEKELLKYRDKKAFKRKE